MGNKAIRVGQLIAPFGPGSLYTDRRGIPHVVCGLDHWFEGDDGRSQLDLLEFERFDSRLAALLRIDRFRRPPDFRSVRRGQEAPPNALLHIPALRFPRWYRHTKTGQLHRFNLHTERITSPTGGGRWLAVRFVAVCAGGHLCEFPWKEWIKCTCNGEGNLLLTDRGGSDLTSIRVECRGCAVGTDGRRGRSLSGTTVKPDVELGEKSALEKEGICCPGERPWLGEAGTEVGCDEPLMAALINQTNLYFPRTVSAIHLPDFTNTDNEVRKLRGLIEVHPFCGVCKTEWRLGGLLGRRDAAAGMLTRLKRQGVDATEDQVVEALEGLFESGLDLAADSPRPSQPESVLVAFRRAEFNVLREEIDDASASPNLRVKRTSVPQELNEWFGRVTLVERLRDTRVFCGFDRLESTGGPLVGMPEFALNQLFLRPPERVDEQWLPAVDVFGEGIYLELSEEAILGWQATQGVSLAKRLDDGIVARIASIFQTLPPAGAPTWGWASRYLLVHGLAHILINQLVFECGYSTAALRERLYVSSDPVAPMAAMLIYTAAGDSEGTLGGLVRLGRPENLKNVVARAVSRASWCSADPVCSEHLGGQGSRMANLAACHACILLPETSCETVNQALDRAMIVGTPDARNGFLAALLDRAYTLS